MGIEIRQEQENDIEEISQVVELAFEDELEANLVSLIRTRGQSLLSLVAIDAQQVIGHVMVSPLDITPPPPGTFGAIAPLSVLPAHQGKGVGSALMLATIEECTKLNLDALFLLGSPKYYPRFGFRPSHVANEYNATEAFMQLELVSASLESVQGLAKYVSAFKELGA